MRSGAAFDYWGSDVVSGPLQFQYSFVEFHGHSSRFMEFLGGLCFCFQLVFDPWEVLDDLNVSARCSLLHSAWAVFEAFQFAFRSWVVEVEVLLVLGGLVSRVQSWDRGAF